MQFKALDGCVYDIKTKVGISYFDFEFDNINKAVDFFCSAAESYDDDVERIFLEMTVEKHEESEEVNE